MTKPPHETATDDHPDRIDFIFARGAGLTVTEAAIVGETGPCTDLVVDPRPSDHRAVVAEVGLRAAVTRFGSGWSQSVAFPLAVRGHWKP